HVDLSRLPNDDLLKHAQAAYQKAAQEYLARARDLAAAETLLDDARKLADTIKPPDAPPPNKTDMPSAEDAARAALAAARTRQGAPARSLKRGQAQKALVDRAVTATDASRTAAAAFLAALDDLRPHVVEIALRVKDDSLAADKVPWNLKAQAVE